MTLPDTIITDAVFIAVYVVLAAATTFNVVRHNRRRLFGYVLLLLFNLLRMVGNALLIVAYHQHYTDQNIIIAGYVMQGLGYSFLLSATLTFLADATAAAAQHPDSGKPRRRLNVWRLLGVVNIVALVLLIIGYNHSTDMWTSLLTQQSSSNANSAKLDTLASIGDIVFLAATAVTALVAIVTTARCWHTRTRDQRVMLMVSIIALPFMLVRSAYVTYTSFQSNPFAGKLVLRIVLELVMEVIVNALYIVMGVMIGTQQHDGASYAEDHAKLNVPAGVQYH